MDEVEYSFKHALAQEIAYESILPRKRMEMHLKVAGSIEKVFSERLHEFYGMLACHYSKAENLEKAEEYLINAGEEALRSSASNEALHWDAEQPPPNIIAFILDPLNPDHGLGNCARASIAMMASVYGKSLSQDRIAYFTEEERSGTGDSIPEKDLAHFVGMEYDALDGGAETDALAWALGQPPTYMQSNPTFNQIKSWLDNNQPIMTRIPLLPIVGLGHVRVIDGYRVDSLNIKWVHILDPLVWFPSPRWEPFTTWNSAASGTWVGPASAPCARGDEASIATDSDNDGIMDFDELKRFGTNPQKKDTDGDGKEDKDEIRGYIFNSANIYDYGDPDGNSNGVRKELDPNE